MRFSSFVFVLGLLLICGIFQNCVAQNNSITQNNVAKTSSQKPQKKVEISNAYMPAISPVSRTAAVYLEISNQTNSQLKLTKLSTPIARHSMVHQTVEVNGVVKMAHQDEVVINPKQAIEFRPGGTHIMLMGLNFIPKERFDLELVFDSAQGNEVLKKTVSVTVRKRE